MNVDMKLARERKGMSVGGEFGPKVRHILHQNVFMSLTSVYNGCAPGSRKSPIALTCASAFPPEASPFLPGSLLESDFHKVN